MSHRLALTLAAITLAGCTWITPPICDDRFPWLHSCDDARDRDAAPARAAPEPPARAPDPTPPDPEPPEPECGR